MELAEGGTKAPCLLPSTVMAHQLHIISFNVPYPPDYGGVMDVFYKIKTLYDYGVKIRLHCFEYGRKESEVLKQVCEEVYYYKREHSFRDFTSLLPTLLKPANQATCLRT
jgi:hypothetical protein